MPAPQDILNELFSYTDKIRLLMNKYPNAIHIFEDKEFGFRIEVNIGLLEIPQEGECQNQE